MDFGSLKGDKAWRTGVILTKTDIKAEAIGSGKKVRGRRHRNWRPDLIVLDDIENDENVNTPEQRRKLKNWFDKAVSKAGDTYTDIMYIGTILHYDSLLNNVLQNPRYKTKKYRAVISEAVNTKLWDEWESIYTNLFNENHEEDARTFYEAHEEEMLLGAEVLWEEKLSYYDLMEIKVSEGTASFNSELQNDPIDPESATFNPEWFDYYEPELMDFSSPEFVFVGANDPSLGKNKKSDTSSIINLALSTKTGYMYVVDASVEKRKALWASLCTIANDFLTKYKRPLFFVCEARGKKADESLEDYVNAMLEERKGINNIYMQVVCSNSRYQRMDGRVQDINNAGIVTGLYGRAKESQSIGEVKSFPISEAKLFKLLPEGIEDYIETLDKAKYVTIRQYIGKEDYYVTSANMMSPEGSDYSYAEDVRVSNRLVKAVRAKALDELQVEVDPGDIETSITNIQEQLNTPVEDAVRDKVISSGSVTIDTENLNILVDEKLDINITYVPMGHVREMNLTFAVENPYAAS